MYARGGGGREGACSVLCVLFDKLDENICRSAERLALIGVHIVRKHFLLCKFAAEVGHHVSTRCGQVSQLGEELFAAFAISCGRIETSNNKIEN